MTVRLRNDLCSEAALVFALAMICYTANGKAIPSGDTLPARYLPFSVLREGNFYLDDYPLLDRGKAYWVRHIRQHYVSFYPVGAAIAALPWYVPAIVGGVEPGERQSEDLEKLAASGIVASSVAVFYAALRQVTNRRAARWITVAYALGTSSLSLSSQGLWQHGPAQLALSLGLFLLVRARHGSGRCAGLAGLPLAFAVVCRQTNLTIFLPLAVYVALAHRRQILLFLMTAAAPFAFQLWYNATYLGDPFWTQFPMRAWYWRGRVRNGLLGLLVSPSRGLFVYSPVLVFSLLGIALSCRRGGDRLVRALGVGVLLDLAVYARWWVWWGGSCYGPRLLADLMPVLALSIYPCVGMLQRHRALRIVFAATLTWSMLAHAAGAYWYDGSWDRKHAGPNAKLFETLWSWRDNPLLNSFREASGKVVDIVAGRAAPAHLAQERALIAQSEASPDDDRALLALRAAYAASGAVDRATRTEEMRRPRFTPERRLDWQFEDELVLAGVDWRLVDSSMLEITYYWRAQRQVSADYALYTRWIGPGCSGKDDRILGAADHPTSRWPAGASFKQRQRLALPTLPAHGCSLHLGVWSPQSRIPLYIRTWPLWKRTRDLLHVAAGPAGIRVLFARERENPLLAGGRPLSPRW